MMSISPILFNILIDLIEVIKKREWRNKFREKKSIYATADNVILMAVEEQDMKVMLTRLERYLDGKGLELNAGKTKVMMLRKRGGRIKKTDWK